MKGNLFLRSFLVGLTTLGVATNAMAVMSVPYGWYAEGNAGQSRISQGYPAPSSSSNTGFGWNANAGYKINPFAAAEIGYTHYASIRIRNGFGTNVANNSHYSYDIAAKGIMPIGTTGAEIFVKAGISRIQSNITVTNYTAAAASGLVFNTGTHISSGVYMGAGGEYSVTPNLLINLQWAKAKGTSKTGDGNLYSGGVSYIF
ncbi:MAG: outer membrane beta-barrel protein [Gammaproteobacteria bacterium]|nr:outer membrane beta-barrel protein [Gammaproteobacteria bacterium]